MVNDIRYLAEWECDGPIMLALPHENTDWVDILPEAIMQYKRIISAFTEHGEKILLIVPDSKRAREVLDREDRVFHPAKAEIDLSKLSVKVSSPDVKDIKSVRYCFKNFAIGKLHDNYGMPVVPFRTDNWDM